MIPNSNPIQTVTAYGLDTIAITRKKICNHLLHKLQCPIQTFTLALAVSGMG